MRLKWMAIGLALAAGLAAMSANPALARVKHKAPRHCAPQPQEFTWSGWLFNPAPQPNGCAPPVYAYGRYEGQDPDPYIRLQLLRDPQTGYRPF